MPKHEPYLTVMFTLTHVIFPPVLNSGGVLLTSVLGELDAAAAAEPPAAEPHELWENVKKCGDGIPP